jgi:hypothetical protein
VMECITIPYYHGPTATHHDISRSGDGAVVHALADAKGCPLYYGL